jgi:hypothetical protein
MPKCFMYGTSRLPAVPSLHRCTHAQGFFTHTHCIQAQDVILERKHPAYVTCLAGWSCFEEFPFTVMFLRIVLMNVYQEFMFTDYLMILLEIILYSIKYYDNEW